MSKSPSEEDIENLSEDTLALLGVQGALAVKAHCGICYLGRRNGVVGQNVIHAADAPEGYLVLILVLPDGLGALQHHIAIGENICHRHGHIGYCPVGGSGAALGREGIRAAGRSRF